MHNFYTYKVARSFLDATFKSEARFYDKGTFALRFGTGMAREGKMAVAHYIAREFCRKGTDVFISDGSSTHYVAYAMMQMAHANQTELRLLTNSIGIAAEVAANPFTPYRDIKLNLLTGTFDSGLCAVFPEYHDDLIKKKIMETPLVIVSVSNLHFSHGPTSPNPHSRNVKQYAFESDGTIVIPLDWSKLTELEPDPGNRVFKNDKAWTEVRDKAGRHIWIICDKPPDFCPQPDCLTVGEKLALDSRNKPGTAQWAQLTTEQRYCWQVYTFCSRLPDTIRFVECVIEDDFSGSPIG